MTANWHCPALCGCVLSINADWATPPENGVSYQHPIPNTIRSIAIVTVCPTHDSLRTDPLPADPWFGCRGYMTVPQSPTEAERLYIALYRYGGQRVRLDTCGCALYETTDRTGSAPQRKGHARHRVRCASHQGDDDAGTWAAGDNTRKNRLVERAADALGMNPGNIHWSFSGTGNARVLTVTLVGASQSVVTQAKTWADANLGAGRVIVVAG